MENNETRAPADFLLVASLALLSVLLPFPWFEQHGQTFDWTVYVILGTIFPSAVLAIGLARRQMDSGARHQPFGKILASETIRLWHRCPWWVLLTAIVTRLDWRATVLAAIQFAILWPLPLFKRKARSGLWFGGAALLWYISMRLQWWSDFPTWTIASFWRLVVFFVSTWLIGQWFFRPGAVPIRNSWLRRAGDIIAITLLGLLAFRPADLSEVVIFHHWSVFVAPVVMLKQGGWLLWDIPAQYGFLSTLFIRALPLKDVWRALYVANSLLLWFGAVLLYRSLRRGDLSAGSNYFMPVLLTISWVFLVPGWGEEITGPQGTPSVGALRFIWCYVLVWQLAKINSYELTSLKTKRALILGCTLWLLGSFWSAESAVYCFAIWIPAYVVLIFGRYSAARTETSLGMIAFWILLPVGLLLACVGAIDAFYQIRLGHLPDWMAFVDPALAYSIGMFTEGISATGSGWILLTVLCVISAELHWQTKKRVLHASTIALLLGSWGAVWATASYYIGRTADNNVNNILPILGLGLASLIFVQRRENTAGLRVTGFCVLPLVVVSFSISYGNVAGVTACVKQSIGLSHRRVSKKLLMVDEELASVLRSAGIDPHKTPIAFIDNNRAMLPGLRNDQGQLLRWHKTWLPIMSPSAIVFLAPERQRLYISRFVDRSKLSGWLIFPKGSEFEERHQWLLDAILRSHQPVKTTESPNWKLTYYVYQR